MLVGGNFSMSDSELLIGNKGLFSASKTWKDHQEKFENNLGTYAYNHPAAKRAANKGLLKLKDTVLKASHAKTTDKEQQVIRDVFFSDKKESAGQVGKNVSSENIDKIIPRNAKALIDNTSDGNLRLKMTAFMNGAYFHDSGANLKQILRNNTGSFHQLGILNQGTLDLIEKSKKFDSNSLKKIDDEKLKQYKLSKQNSYKSLIQRQKSLSEEASNLKAHFNEQFLSYVKEDIPKFNNKIDMKINTFKNAKDVINKREKCESADEKSIDNWKLKMKDDLIKRQKNVDLYKKKAEQNTRNHYILKFIAKMKNKSLLKKMNLTEEELNHNFYDDFNALNTVKYQKPNYINKSPEEADQKVSDASIAKKRDDLIARQANVISYKQQAEQNTRNHYILKFIAKMKNKSLLKKMNLTEEELNHNFYDDFVALNKTNYKKPDHEYQDSPDYALDGSNAEEVSSEKLYKYINDRGSSYDDKLRKRKKDPSKDFDISVLGDLVQFKRITKDEKSRYLYILNRISDLEKLKPTLEFEANLEGDDLRKYYWYLTERTKNNMQDVDMYKWGFITKSSSLEGDNEHDEIINQFMSTIPERIKNLDQQMQQINNSTKPISEEDKKHSLKKLEKEKKKLQEFSTESLAQKLVNISNAARLDLNDTDSANFKRTADYYKSIGAELSESELNFLGTKENSGGNQTPINTDQALPWISGKMSSTLDTKSPFYEVLIHKKGMNLVTGISGTTARMLQSYKYLGFTDNEDLLNFRLALIGWMILGEDHSLYEILMGSHIVGVKGNENLSDASTMDKSVSPLSIDELRKNVCEQYNNKGLFPDEICYLEERFDDKHNNGMKINNASSVEDKVKNIDNAFNSDFAELGNSFSPAEALSIRSYTSMDYKFVNHILPLSPEKAEAEIEERVKYNIRQRLKHMTITGNYLPAFVRYKIRDYMLDSKSDPNISKPNIESDVNNIYNSHPDINAKHILAVFSSEIQIISSALKKIPNKYKGRIYRGFGIKKGHEAKYQVGQIIPFKKLTSTSTKLSKAEGFRNSAKGKGKVGALYDISATGKYGVDIHALSQYTDESEILMPPGAKIKITDVTKDENGDLYIKGDEV